VTISESQVGDIKTSKLVSFTVRLSLGRASKLRSTESLAKSTKNRTMPLDVGCQESRWAARHMAAGTWKTYQRSAGHLCVIRVRSGKARMDDGSKMRPSVARSKCLEI
jgi:hypothetical protein